MNQAAFADAARHYQAAVTALEGRELISPEGKALIAGLAAMKEQCVVINGPKPESTGYKP